MTHFWFVSELAQISPEREVAGIRRELATLNRSISALNLQLGQVLVDADVQKALITDLSNRAEIANDPAGKQAILAEIAAKRALLRSKNREAEEVKGQREGLLVRMTALHEREVLIDVQLDEHQDSTREQVSEKPRSFEAEVRRTEELDRPK